MSQFLGARLQPDEQLDAVAHVARRRLLIGLLDQYSQGDTAIEVEQVVADAPATPADMRHTHLPKLEDRGFVRWDREARLVAHGPQFDEIEPLLGVLYDNRDELPDEWL